MDRLNNYIRFSELVKGFSAKISGKSPSYPAGFYDVGKAVFVILSERQRVEGSRNQSKLTPCSTPRPPA
jgi:hypothetical protein